MLRKTTVYLSEDDLRLLRKKSVIKKVTVAEVIRSSIQEACKPNTREEKEIWDSLDKIWAKTDSLSGDEVENAVGKAVKEVRHGKKARRHN